MRLLLLTALLFILPLQAQAQDYNTILDIPEGQTLINLSATERVTIDQDLLVAQLRFEAEHKDAKVLQDKINEVMKEAVDKAKSTKDVKVTTQQYYVYPHEYDPNPRPYERGEPPRQLAKTWRGQQGLMLESKNAEALLKLTGALQELGLTINSLNYQLSKDLMEETQESLLEAALTKLSAKAERAAKALGKSKAELREVNVDMGGGYRPQPMMRGMAVAEMSMAKMDAPVAEAGESDITLTVSARAILK